MKKIILIIGIISLLFITGCSPSEKECKNAYNLIKSCEKDCVLNNHTPEWYGVPQIVTNNHRDYCIMEYCYITRSGYWDLFRECTEQS